MQVFYALPFIALSAICGVVCLLIPRLRRFALAAAVGPVAFGLCSIIGVAAVLVGESIGWFNEPFALYGFFWVVCGVIGAWITVRMANALSRRFGL
jgi:hypothetical protein